MNISSISAVIFSPTETTKTVIETLGENLPLPTSLVDITIQKPNNLQYRFASEELVIFAAPVYGGRIPAIAVEKIKHIKGQQTPAVLIVTYGNRAYDDALLELKDLIEGNGFVSVAAAAFVTEHSIMHSVAKGRPDREDNKAIGNFAIELWNKIQNSDSVSGSIITVPGNTPYVAYGGVPFKPQTSDTCTSCGTCVINCPVDAIAADDPSKTNNDRCISCLRCLKVCPMQARKLDAHMLAGAEQAFAEKFHARREPETFI